MWSVHLIKKGSCVRLKKLYFFFSVNLNLFLGFDLDLSEYYYIYDAWHFYNIVPFCF